MNETTGAVWLLMDRWHATPVCARGPDDGRRAGLAVGIVCRDFGGRRYCVEK